MPFRPRLGLDRLLALEDNAHLPYNILSGRLRAGGEVMFERLSERLGSVLDRLRGRGVVSASDVSEAMREIRRALLEADVNIRVAREMVDRVAAEAVGERVLKSLTPGQQIVKIVYDELVRTMSHERTEPDTGGRRPVVWLLAGLQGAGKTTTAAKLAVWAAGKRGMRPMLAACDLKRPAAVDQLGMLAGKTGMGFYEDRTSQDPARVAADALAMADREMYDLLIVDSSGRLHVDDDLMAELESIRAAVSPRETLLVLDGMTGQDAVNVALEFDRRIGLTGAVLSKMDGDSRGGAALSTAAVTGRPVLFLGTGEGPGDLEAFDPARMAGRILGMGDVLGLVEKAVEASDRVDAEKLERRLRKGEFTMDDLLAEFGRLRKMGSLADVLAMLPAGILPKGLEVDPRELGRREAIIRSMTPDERRRPERIDGSRRKRIARGSGVAVRDVNRLLDDYRAMKEMMKRLGKSSRLASLLRG